MMKRTKQLKNTMTKLLAAALMVAMLPVTAYADTVKEPLNDAMDLATYYTNYNGVDFTKEQYDRLMEYYSEDEIDIMQPEFAEPLFENLYDFTVEQQSIYVQTLESVDEDGNVITTEKETVLTEEQAKYMDKLEVDAFPAISRESSQTHETASKIITLKFNSFGGSTRGIVLSCSWKKLPVTRSYDIMAIAPSNSIHFNTPSAFSASQVTDAGTTRYSMNSSGVNIDSKGIGISMNLYNDATKSIVCTMECVLASTVEPFVVYGTYQHCQSDISQSDSKKYSIEVSSANMGGILKFSNSSIASKYDNTQGLKISGTLENH